MRLTCAYETKIGGLGHKWNQGLSCQQGPQVVSEWRALADGVHPRLGTRVGCAGGAVPSGEYLQLGGISSIGGKACRRYSSQRQGGVVVHGNKWGEGIALKAEKTV